MLVGQARGGTNRPDVCPDVFAMPAGMRMRYDLPDPALAGCISGYAIYISDSRAPLRNWYLPAPGMLIVLLDAGPMSVQFRTRRETDLPQATVWGPTTHAFQTITHGGISVGVGLTAEGWARLTRMSARRSRDRILTLPAVVDPRGAQALVATLESLDDDAQIAPALDRLLPSLFDQATPGDAQIRALDRSLHDPNVGGVDDLARRLGMNSRALRQLCTEQMGMTAKTLLTRARFIRSYAGWLKAGRPGGYEGIDTRYFDDAHFLRDARSFLGSTPRRLQETETVYLRTSMRARAAVIGAPAHALYTAA